MSNTISCNNLIRSNIFIDAALKNEFKKLAKKKGVSFATILRAAMVAYIGSKSEPFEFKQAAAAKS